MRHTRNYRSKVGNLGIICDDDYLIGLEINETIEETDRDYPLLLEIERWLDDYFLGKKMSVEGLPIKLIGSEFQKKVWTILLNIPYGQTMHYGQIAKMIDPKMSAQAVGTAVGHNPIGIIVPCHRVLGKNNLGGFASGMEIKMILLKLEGII